MLTKMVFALLSVGSVAIIRAVLGRGYPSSFVALVIFLSLAYALVAFGATIDSLKNFYREYPWLVPWLLAFVAVVTTVVTVQDARRNQNAKSPDKKLLALPAPTRGETLPVPVSAPGSPPRTRMRFDGLLGDFLGAGVLFIILTFLSSVLLDHRATKEARALLEKTISQASTDPGRFFEALMSNPSIAGSWQLPGQAATAEDLKQGIAGAQRMALDRLAGLRAPAERKAAAKAEIESLAREAQANAPDEIARSAAQSLESIRHETLRALRPLLEQAGAAAGSNAKRERIPSVLKQFDTDTGTAPADRTARLAAEVLVELDTAVRTAMEEAAREQFKSKAPEATRRISRVIAEAVQRLTARAETEMNAVIARLQQALAADAAAKEKREREAAADAYVAQQQRAGDGEQRNPRLDLLRSQFQAYGFESCEDRTIDGTVIFGGRSEIASEAECAQRCGGTPACDGFEIRGRPGALHCMMARNSFTRPNPGRISGRRGGC